MICMLALLQTNAPSKSCTCPAVPAKEQTRWGNERIVLSTETRVHLLRGTINDWHDDPMPNSLVEVYTDPDVITLEYSPEIDARRAKQRRIAACITDAKGRFCLSDLPVGRYELRCSATGFQAISQRIRVVGKGQVKKQITVHMHVAT
jgi:hypothetical protein